MDETTNFLSDFKKPMDVDPRPEIIPLHLRPKKLNFWDQRPIGYDSMSADQIKATGMFLLPSHLLKGTGAFNQPQQVTPYGALGLLGYNQTQEQQLASYTAPVFAGVDTKKVFVSGLAKEVTSESLSEFISLKFEEIGEFIGNVIVKCQIVDDKRYAFVDFNGPAEATAALNLDGSELLGVALKVKRTKDYKAGDEDPFYTPGVVSTVVQDTVNKVFIGGLPTYVSDDQVMDLLKAFGELKAFTLVKDTLTGVSKGFAFCEYLDMAMTDVACEGLHGLELGDKKLIVQRAGVGQVRMILIDGALPGAGLGRPILPIEILGENGLKQAEPTTILMLLNMVEKEDLENEYDDIVQDATLEFERFGTVLETHIPKPITGKFVPGVGKVYCKFENKESCQKAQRALAGRKFMNRTVLTTFFDEYKYEARVF